MYSFIYIYLYICINFLESHYVFIACLACSLFSYGGYSSLCEDQCTNSLLQIAQKGIHFTERWCKGFPGDANEVLISYSWPPEPVFWCKDPRIPRCSVAEELKIIGPPWQCLVPPGFLFTQGTILREACGAETRTCVMCMIAGLSLSHRKDPFL